MMEMPLKHAFFFIRLSGAVIDRLLYICYTVAPSVNRVYFSNILYDNRCDNIARALSNDLPFKIPCSRKAYVEEFQDIFYLGSSDIDVDVLKWLQYEILGNSETSTVILDSHWISIIRNSIRGCLVKQNQHDASSIVRLRPDTVIEVNGAVCLKGEAKSETSDFDAASAELIDKFNQDAFKVFPSGCTTIIGVVSAINQIRLFYIHYENKTKQYSTSLFSQYAVDRLQERVRYLVDIVKIMRFIACITDSNVNFHLSPGIRLKTRNNHHVTWNKEGLLKEFDHHRDFDVQLERMNAVYNFTPKPLHIEYGYVNNHQKSCTITRIGNKLNSLNISRFSLTKESICAQVKQGLDELHIIGFAHCDICIDNVYIADDGIVFLDDLEYLTPVNDPPPHFTRLPYGVTKDQVITALKLDDFQFITFQCMVTNL